MNGKTKEYRTHLSKEFLDVAVGQRVTLVCIRSSMSSPMSAFSIKEGEDGFSEEVADVSGAMAFLLRGMEGMVTPLWEGAGTWLEQGQKELPLDFQ